MILGWLVFYCNNNIVELYYIQYEVHDDNCTKHGVCFIIVK